jgi:hypothetical protein
MKILQRIEIQKEVEEVDKIIFNYVCKFKIKIGRQTPNTHSHHCLVIIVVY